MFYINLNLQTAKFNFFGRNFKAAYRKKLYYTDILKTISESCVNQLDKFDIKNKNCFYVHFEFAFIVVLGDPHFPIARNLNPSS